MLFAICNCCFANNFCDYIKQLVDQSTTTNPKIPSLTELQNNLGNPKTQSISQQTLAWGNYQVTVREGKIISTFNYGDKPTAIRELSAFDKNNLTKLKQSLGEPKILQTIKLTKYTWDNPDNNCKLITYSQRPNIIDEIDGRYGNTTFGYGGTSFAILPPATAKNLQKNLKKIDMAFSDAEKNTDIFNQALKDCTKGTYPITSYSSYIIKGRQNGQCIVIMDFPANSSLNRICKFSPQDITTITKSAENKKIQMEKGQIVEYSSDDITSQLFMQNCSPLK